MLAAITDLEGALVVIAIIVIGAIATRLVARDRPLRTRMIRFGFFVEQIVKRNGDKPDDEEAPDGE